MRNNAARRQAERDLQKPLGRLELALRERPYLLGEAFSAADLNVAGVINSLAGCEPET
ncbi:glutathione S-transferase C-terminal domain-containing protein [Chromobacterium sphagni]|nr:glutathione S-transferase C-terminal domain-containing protein [Chromobacterium sphagni]